MGSKNDNDNDNDNEKRPKSTFVAPYWITVPIHMVKDEHRLVSGTYCLVFGSEGDYHHLPLTMAYFYDSQFPTPFPYGLHALYNFLKGNYCAKMPHNFTFPIRCVHWPTYDKPLAILLGPFNKNDDNDESEMLAVNDVLNYYRIQRFQRRVCIYESE